MLKTSEIQKMQEPLQICRPTQGQRSMVAASIADLTRSDSRHAGNNCKFAVDSRTRAEAAQKLNVSERSVNSAKKVRQVQQERQAKRARVQDTRTAPGWP